MSNDAQPVINQIFAERLFLHVLEDLYNRREYMYLYQRLNCGRLLRQLLIDGDVLCNIANRRVRIPIRFITIEYGEPPDDLELVPDATAKYTVPTAGTGAYLLPLKLDAYLSRPIANYGDEWITVRDVVKYVANNYGGVHLDSGDLNLAKLHKMDHMVSANGEGAIFGLLSSITNTSLAALLPIRDALVERFAADNIDTRMLDHHRVAHIPSPGTPDQRRGTISFWLKTKRPDWHTNPAAATFAPMQHGPFRVQVIKLGSRLRIEVDGIFGRSHVFDAPMPAPETVAPEHGVHVLISWDDPKVSLWVQGKEVTTAT
jgi:hypothetical protein